MSHKNAVLTYIFGNKEILREPLIVEPGIEYICVTDDYNLKSDTFNIIVEQRYNSYSSRNQMPFIKYQPFQYTTASNIIVMDGALQITNSIAPLFDKLQTNEMLVKKHPHRNNLFDELMAWRRGRGMPTTQALHFLDMCHSDMINPANIPVLETNIYGLKVNPNTKTICSLLLELMKLLCDVPNNLFLSNQIILSYLLQTNVLHKYSANRIKYSFITEYPYVQRYKHNTWNK